MFRSQLQNQFMRKSRRIGSMTGFALWDVLLLVALIASILLTIFLIQQSRNELQTVEQRSATLLWADQEVAGFASANLRLPCPDTDGDGNEDCGAGASSGMLPYLTMGLRADAATRGLPQVKYSVLRPTTPDLSLLESFFEPVNWEGTAYTYGTSNGLDFCGKLYETIDVGSDASNGFTNPGAVAYSVAVKQRDGNPDLVRNHSAAALANSMSCITTLSSVNSIALAVDVVLEVVDQQESTKQDAIITIAFNVLHIVLAGIDVVLAAIGLAGAIATLATSASALAGAIASCIVLVGCAFIPVYTAAVVASVVAIVLFGVAIASGALAIAALVYSTVLAVEVAIATGSASGNQTLTVDLAQQLQGVLDLEAKATQAEADAAAESVKLANALTARNNALNSINTIKAADPATPAGVHDPLVAAAVAATIPYDDARIAQINAQGAFDEANKTLAELNQAITISQTNCTNATLPKEQYKCDAVPRVIARRDAAQITYNTTLSTLNAANANVTTTRTTYENARNAALAAYNGFYTGFDFSCFCIRNAFDTYLEKYFIWQKVTISNNTLAQTAIDTRASAVSARAAYVQLEYNATHPGTTPTGSAILVWNGAEAILEQADANGDVE